MKIRNKTFIISLIFSFLVSIILCSVTVQAMPLKPKVTPSDYSTGMTWDKAMKEQKPIAVNFYVDWCHYCQRFAPILDDLRKEYKSKMNFVFINADDPKNSALVEEFGIEGYPTLYLVNPKKNCKVMVEQSLYSSPDLLRQEIDKFLEENK